MRFLHTADWQLGMTRHFLDADAQPRYTAARTDAVRRLGRLAAETGCEFVLVCGDVFESNALGPRVVARAVEALRDVPVPVYLLPGNHDPLDAASVYASPAFTAAKPAHVHVLTLPGAHVVRPGVEILAAPWFSKRPTLDLVGDVLTEPASEGADGVLRVVAGHGAVDALFPDATGPARIRLADAEAALRGGVVHYVALGDRHSTTSVGRSGAVWYPGTPEVTDFDEVDPGNVLVVDVEPGRDPVVTPHRVGEWRFEVLHGDVGSTDDVGALDERLAAVSGKERAVVRLSLVGTLAVADKALLDDVLARHARLFASVQLWEPTSDLAVYLDADQLTDLGLTGFAAGAVAELAGRATSGGSDGSDGAGSGEADDARTARDALQLVYRLTGGGR